MDYLQVHAPVIWRFIKKGVPRSFKQVILRWLTSKDPELMFEGSSKLLLKKTGIKITFILIREEKEEIDFIKEFKALLLSFTRHKEFIIVTKGRPILKNIFLYRPKIVTNLSDAILASTGDYLCILGHEENFLNTSALKLFDLIEKTKGDIYIGNYIDVKNDLVRILPPEVRYDFSSSVLPMSSNFGIKIISKDIAIKTRLPRNGVFSYLLEASDKTKKVVYLEKALVKNTLSQTETKKALNKLSQIQAETLKRRAVYGDNKMPNKIEKILFVVPFLVIGGAEKVLFDLVSNLIVKGFKVDIFCTHKDGEWLDKFKKTGVNIFVSKRTGNEEKVNEIFNLANKNKYDVIHISNTEYGHYFSAKSKELEKIPIIIDTVHSQNNPLTSNTIEFQSSINKVVTVNQLINNVLKNSITPSKLVPVLNGISLDVTSNKKAKEKFKSVEITFLGRISEEKNPFEFIKIAEACSLNHPEWKFKIIGDGPLMGKIKSEVAKQNLKNISILGAKEEGAQELVNTSCLIITSFTEGLPITLLEALTLGIPVISSNVGGISEVLEDGKAGYLVDKPSDTKSYVEKLEKLLSNSEKYINISKNAKNISADFTAEKMTEKVIKVYKEALSEIPEKFNKLTTIAMLSFNRKEETKKTLETIYKNTKLPFNVLVLDNNSDVPTRNFLKKFEKEHNNFKVLLESKNLGCPGGRQKMLKNIQADYIVTIDNDMEVPEFWLRDLIVRIEENNKYAGVCVKDVFPWGKVEFTGGKITKDNQGFSLFNATHYRKNYNDLSTLEEFECDWIPGGATLWRGNIRQIAEHSNEYINAFEDFDYSLQIRKKGFKIVNCPNVMFIHNHASGYDKVKQRKEAKYIEDRNNQKGFFISMAVFYKRTGHIMRNDKLFEMFGFRSFTTPKEVRSILEKEGKNVKPIK